MDDEIKRVRNCRTHYEVLGIERDAQEADIKKAYRRLALKLHPDKNHGEFAEAAFKAVSEAEACLSNSVSRKKYDALIRDGRDGRGSALDFGTDEEEDSGPTVLEAWRQCTTADFVLFVALLGLKKAVVSVGTVLYVVVVLAKAVFYERLSGGQRTGVCVLLALNNLLLSIGRESFGTKVFVGAGVGLIVLTLIANGKILSAAGFSIFGFVYNYWGGGLVLSLLTCVAGWLALGLVVWPMLPTSAVSDQQEQYHAADAGSTNRAARRAAAAQSTQPAGPDLPAKKKKGKGRRRA